MVLAHRFVYIVCVNANTAAHVKELARQAGFDLCGICVPDTIPEAQARFHRWLERGFHAEMAYLARDPERRTDPHQVMPSVRSIIMLGLNYFQPDSEDQPPACGRVSRYARGRDYHKVIAGMCRRLIAAIRADVFGTDRAKFRAMVDFGPFLERAYAQQAGLGYLGKNGLLINERFGSWLFLAEILTSLELPVDHPRPEDHGSCLDCRLCIEACPTGAIVADGVVKASKCISSLTIERPSHIKPGFARQFGDRLFGCDTCQEVCPHNRKAVPTRCEDLRSNRGVSEFVSLDRVLALQSQQQFLELTAGTPLTRPKLDGLQRNAAIVSLNLRAKRT